jgi:hypothetical protein
MSVLLPGVISTRVVAALAVLPLFVLAWLGADWATKFQFVIMATLVAALATFTIGALHDFDGDRLAANWDPSGTMPFWALFALFFPAVTGFTQGVSMSGELRDPARSLPLGTFLAVGVSVVVYVGVAILFAGAAPGAELVGDYDMMRRISWLPAMVTAGVCAATLSSALASFLGAPRILQALASDKLFPFLTPFAAVQPKTGNPRRAVLLASTIAFATIAAGDLNMIAPLVTMFFLVSYGLLNYATYYEANARSPSFRPRFRFYHKWISLGGCLVCAGMMLAIDPTAGAIAIAVLLAIYHYVGRTILHARWADSTRSAQFQRIRQSLYAMNETAVHDRDWRPVILAFTDDPERRERLLRFASWIEGGSGLTTAVRILEGQGARARRAREEAEVELAEDLEKRELQAFARVVVTTDLRAGFEMLLQSAGMGPIRANLALFHWFDREAVARDAPAMRAYGEYLLGALRLGCSVVVLAARQDDLERLAAEDEGEERRIDVWWQADASSRLSLLLAYLTTRHQVWSGAKLRVLVPRGLDVGEGGGDVLEMVRTRLDEVRIRAEAVLVEGGSWQHLQEAVAGASLVFYSFRVRPEGPCDVTGALLPTSLEGMPPLVLVNAAKDIQLDAEPDEGKQGDEARARDAVEAAAKGAAKRRAAAEEAQREVEDLQQRLEQARKEGDDAALRSLEHELEERRAHAEQLGRRADVSEAKAEQLGEGSTKDGQQAAAKPAPP